MVKLVLRALRPRPPPPLSAHCGTARQCISPLCTLSLLSLAHSPLKHLQLEEAYPRGAVYRAAEQRARACCPCAVWIPLPDQSRQAVLPMLMVAFLLADLLRARYGRCAGMVRGIPTVHSQKLPHQPQLYRAILRW